MKQNLLKFGLLILNLTIIINIYLKENTFYYIKRDLKTKLQTDNYYSMKDLLEVKKIPVEKYLSKEEYYNILNSNNGYIQKLMITSTVKNIKPFENLQSLLVSITLCFAIGLIILGIDFTHYSIQKNKPLLFIAIPLIIYSFSIEELINSNLNSNKAILDEVKNEISYLKNNLQDITSNLETKFSD